MAALYRMSAIGMNGPMDGNRTRVACVLKLDVLPWDSRCRLADYLLVMVVSSQ